MRLRPVDGQGFGSGLLFAGAGILGLILAGGYSMGTAGRMGPGYFPMLVSGGLTLIGVVLLVRSLRIEGAAIAPFNWRVVVCGAGAIAAFGVLIRPAGLVAAVAALTVLMGLARPGARWVEIGVVSVVMALFCWLVFIVGLDAPMRLWGRLGA